MPEVWSMNEFSLLEVAVFWDVTPSGLVEVQ
jgi:hypothetical protein